MYAPMDVVATIMYGASMATAPNAKEKTNQQANILVTTDHRWVAAALLPGFLASWQGPLFQKSRWHVHGFPNQLY